MALIFFSSGQIVWPKNCISPVNNLWIFCCQYLLFGMCARSLALRRFVFSLSLKAWTILNKPDSGCQIITSKWSNMNSIFFFFFIPKNTAFDQTKILTQDWFWPVWMQVKSRRVFWCNFKKQLHRITTIAPDYVVSSPSVLHVWLKMNLTSQEDPISAILICFSQQDAEGVVWSTCYLILITNYAQVNFFVRPSIQRLGFF